MPPTFVEQIGQQILQDAQEVRGELLARTQNNSAIVALQHIARTTPRMVQMLAMMHSANGGVVSKDQLEATIDLTLGDILPLSDLGFRMFCDGDNCGLDPETATILRTYRTSMLARLNAAFQKAVD